jgi:NADH-quinone oxidoreductase subunit N
MLQISFQLLIQIAITAILLVNLLLYIIRKSRPQLIFNIIIFGLLLAYSTYLLFAQVYQTGEISSNPFSLAILALISIGMILVHILAYGDKEQYVSFATIGSFAASGMYLVATASSLMLIFIGMELMVLPTVLAILASNSKHVEAAIKLFVISIMSAAILSFGIVLVYGAVGTISFVQLPVIPLASIALVFLIASLGFEASMFPFNMWVPDTYEGSPAYLTAMIGGLNKTIGFAAIIEILFLLFIKYSSSITIIFYILAVITMFYGNLIALSQKNVKRMLAYSAIAQAGYMAIGIAVATQYSISATIFYLFAHMFMFIGAMAIVAFMETKNRSAVEDYTGLYHENKFAALALTIMFISMIGVPLTIGFVGKFMLFSSAVYSGMMLLALIAILNSAISIYYFLKVIMNMFANKTNPKHISISRNLFVVAAICVIAVVLIGVFPNILIHLSSSASSYILNP